MDQIRTFFRVMWQQRFWVLSITALIIASLCWMLAASDIDKQFQAEITKVNTGFQKVNQINSTQYHGNPEVNEKDRDQAQILRKRVLELWTTLFQKQKEEALVWPEEDLKARFINEIKDKQFDDPISRTSRNVYFNYIKENFEDLLKIVQAKDERSASGSARRGGGEYGGEFSEYGGGARASVDGEEDDDYLVRWLDQQEVADKMDFQEAPSARQIWVTQEDLWVYQTLLKVIADTNKAKGANRPDNTAIRTIMTLSVGKDAAARQARQGSILMPAVSTGGGRGEYGSEFGGEYGGGEYGGGGGYGSEFGGEYGGEFGGRGEYDGEGAGADDAVLLTGRYVDETGKPIEATEPSELGKTYRRLPVSMVLEMDERWVPKVLVECANATLPVEVTRLRVNPSESGEGFGGTGGTRGGGGEYGARGQSSSSAGMRDLSTVEIEGVVSIYFPPQKDEIPSVGDEEVEDLTTAAAETTLK